MKRSYENHVILINDYIAYIMIYFSPKYLVFLQSFGYRPIFFDLRRRDNTKPRQIKYFNYVYSILAVFQISV